MSNSSTSEHQRNLQTIETLVSKWKEEGNGFYHQKNYPPAIEKYTKIIQLLKLQHSLFNPTSSNQQVDEALKQTLLNVLYVSYSNRCACYLQINNVPSAHQDAKECINLKPDWPKGYHRLVNCLIRMGNYEEALVTYEQLLIIEPNESREIHQQMQRLRQQMASASSSSSSTSSSSSSRSSSTTYNGTSSYQNGSTNRSPSWSDQLQSIPWQAYYQSFKQQLLIYYGKFLTWYTSLSEESRNYLKLGIVAVFIYYFFFYGMFSSSYGSYTSPRRGYYDSYDYSYGYGGYYSRGLSWSAWIAIIAGAYYVPPMFPQLLGEQFARPFFGLNFTTFIWLVQIFSNSNRGGYGGYYGRPRRYYY